MSMVDSGYAFEIVSKFPLVSPPIGPWRIGVTFDVLDGGLPAAVQQDSRDLVSGPLAEAVARWRETDPTLAHCRRLTEALGEVERRLEAARSDVARLGREIDAALLHGRSHQVDELMVKVASARADVAFLTERKDKLFKDAGTAKDLAEAAFRAFIKGEAAKLRREAEAQLRAAADELCAAAAGPLKRLMTCKGAVAIASRFDIDDQHFQAALAGVRPDGYAADRKIAAQQERAKNYVPGPCPQGIG